MPASIRDVASRAGVSTGTVSNVLNRPDKVSPETVAKVLAVVAELGFVRNDAARQLRAGSSRSIGFIVLDAGNPFFTDVARGAEHAAAEAHVSVVVGNSDQDAEREISYLDLFEEQRVRGVLISPVGDVVDRLLRLRQRGIPAVLLDRRDEQDRFSSVSVDDLAGGRLAARHLLESGRRRIAFVGGPFTLRQVTDRHAGAVQAVGEVPGASLRTVEIAQLTVIHGREAGLRLLAEPRSEWPDAVFAANDLVAMGLLQAFRLIDSVEVPQRIALIGYDDIDFASAAVVPITSVRQPRELIGRTAVELIGETEPRQVLFQPDLVVRESTAVV